MECLYEQISLNLDEEYMVVQDNRMIMAKYDMSLLEQKLFLILVSTIKKDDKAFKETSLRVKDLAEIMGVSPENLYRDLKKICLTLTDKKVEVEKDDGGWLIAPIMKYAEYHKDKGIISLCLNDKLEPYFLQLKKFFTQYGLENALSLSGKYSIRIYQLSKSYLYKNEFIIPLDEFKNKLSLTAKSYDQYKTMNQRVLSPSISEINSKTDINITCEGIKEGRSIKHLKFTVKNKNSDQKKVVKFAKKSKGHFNNYEQRTYDNLEAMLMPDLYKE